jgi:hypothetical protein
MVHPIFKRKHTGKAENSNGLGANLVIGRQRDHLLQFHFECGDLFCLRVRSP